MIYYVAGLLFSEDRRRVALIRKDHGPANVAGRWNAIGGKRGIDAWGPAGTRHPDWPNGMELAHAAMVREFQEEAGVTIHHWRRFLTLVKPGEWEVVFFSAFDDSALDCVHTAEREVVDVFTLPYLLGPVSGVPIVANLRWIIPMALDGGTYDVTEA